MCDQECFYLTETQKKKSLYVPCGHQIAVFGLKRVFGRWWQLYKIEPLEN